MGSGSPDTSTLRLAQKPPTEPKMWSLGKGRGQAQGRGTGIPEASWAGGKEMAGGSGHTGRLAAVPRSLGQEAPLEEGMATHSSILAWRIPWTEEPGRLQPWGHKRVGHHLATKQQQQTQ